MDPENVVVRLCVDGMAAEGRGDFDGARRRFEEAWAAAGDAFESCVAAHYVARHQPTPEDALRWNEEALRLADAVGDERVADFYPSLLLNLGHSYETLGRADEAKRHYDLAAASAGRLGDDRYGRMVREGTRAAVRRAEER